MFDILLQILATASWVALVVVGSIRLEASEVSEFEIARQAETGDADARKELKFRRRLPEAKALQRVAAILLAAIYAVIMAQIYGAWFGLLFSIGAYLLFELVRHQRIVWEWSEKQFVVYETHIFKVASYIDWLLKLIIGRRKPRRGQPFWSKAELLDMLEHDQTVLNPEEQKAITQVIKFKKRSIKQFMTPVAQIDYVKASDTPGPMLLDQLHKTGHGCFPVVDGDINHVVGMLYLEDLMDLNPDRKKVKDAMYPHVFIISQDQNVEELLRQCLQAGRHLFIVVDDKSKTVGLVTMSDALRQLLGRDITDTNTGSNTSGDNTDIA